MAATQEVAEHLRGAGYDARAYSGQTEQAERLAAEDDLLGGRLKALVATSALGMGFDMPDLGWVVNLGAPASPIAYYQQVGRAGRAIDRAVAVLLPGREDRDIWDYFGSLAFPSEPEVRQALAILGDAGKPLSTAALEPHVTLRRTRLEMMLKVLDVDGAVRRVRGGWVATGEPWAYDAERYSRVRETRRAEQAAMLDYVAAQGCRMEFLRQALDDPGAGRCGRCDNCGGLELAQSASGELVEQAQQRLERPGVTVEPRKMWPTGMSGVGVSLSGKIPAAEQAEEGRAIARLTDLGWGRALHDLLRDGAPDGEIPVPLRHALVQTLDAWAIPGGRPDGIVVIGSATRPQLVGHLGDGLSRYLGVPVLATFDVLDPDAPSPHDVNSAQRLRAVARRHRLSTPPAVEGQRVLLLDDRTDTGWTLAVCAQALRQAGAARGVPARARRDHLAAPAYAWSMSETIADPQHDITATYAVDPALARRLAARVVAGPDGGSHTPTAPFTGAPIAALPVSTAADVDRAFAAARAAQPAWAAVPLRDKAAIMLRFHDLVLDRQRELLDLVQIECGKARAHAFEEIADVALVARHYARRTAGYLRPHRRGGLFPVLTQSQEVRHPKGVVGVVSPWNYPLTLAISDAVPALMAGNAIVLRPDQQTSLTALLGVQLLVEAGLPAEVLQVVLGPGPGVGEAVIERADYVCYTGSTATGRQVAQVAARRLVGVSLELGGKNTMYVAADANLERAAEGAVRACFNGAGQLCVAMERLVVHEAVADRFLELFLGRVRGMRLGRELDWNADMGSLLSPSQLATVTRHVDDAIAHGATRAGRRPGSAGHRSAVLRADRAGRRHARDALS